ncbi:MAG: phosphoribosylanthranilate isomerase, partial [Chitinophagia bacterium]|nr:phosphoribosylanthranilate isomerase [Chitinophagia bacterium]
DISKKIRENISIPTYLAGGINKDNVRKAIEHVEPFGIDLCSSVRTNGQLDELKLEELFKAIS